MGAHCSACCARACVLCIARPPPAPAHVSGKAALRKWVKAHVRWAPARVTEVTDTHVWVRAEGGASLYERLSVQEVSNRLVIRSE